jgi:2-amino-4-hydroxy-6-hydroxymethyldihydropteridine diphosphokinase
MRAYIAVGSNVGDRWGFLALAARHLRAAPGVSVARASRVWDTEPVGPAQPRYLNAVLEVETGLAPGPLLRVLQDVERAAGRLREVRWGPRTLDLDLLLLGGIVLRVPGLVLPHPELARRRFVLAPLAELAAGAPVPGAAATVADLLAAAPPLDVRVAGAYPL